MGFLNGWGLQTGLQTTQNSLMDNLNHPPAFGWFLNACRLLGALLQGKATTAITPLLPTDFSFHLAVRCRWGQKP